MIVAIGVIVILGRLGVNVGPLIASAGIVGIAIGFGAQTIVRDFLSGVFMILENQYGVGDVVTVNGITGTVEDVGLRITTIRDVDGTVWYVANGSVTELGNRSQGWSVAVVDVPVAHSADLEQAKEVLMQTVSRPAGRRAMDQPDHARRAASSVSSRSRPRRSPFGSGSTPCMSSRWRWLASCESGPSRRSRRPASRCRSLPRAPRTPDRRLNPPGRERRRVETAPRRVVRTRRRRRGTRGLRRRGVTTPTGPGSVPVPSSHRTRGCAV